MYTYLITFLLDSTLKWRLFVQGGTTCLFIKISVSHLSHPWLQYSRWKVFMSWLFQMACIYSTVNSIHLKKSGNITLAFFLNKNLLLLTNKQTNKKELKNTRTQISNFRLSVDLKADFEFDFESKFLKIIRTSFFTNIVKAGQV